MIVALILGRFQPFHLGHLYLIKQALRHADKVIIAVGSSNITGADNPLSYKVRAKMLERVIREERLADKILKIIPSPDHPDDKIWLEKLIKKAGKFDVSIGNNGWVNGILKNAGYKVVEIPFHRRGTYQGKIVRKKFLKNEKWQDRVPSYLAEEIKKNLRPSS